MEGYVIRADPPDEECDLAFAPLMTVLDHRWDVLAKTTSKFAMTVGEVNGHLGYLKHYLKNKDATNATFHFKRLLQLERFVARCFRGVPKEKEQAKSHFHTMKLFCLKRLKQ